MRVKDESKRLSILENTVDIVYEKGFAGLNMAGLAKRVGISVSTLYVYYKSKEELVYGIQRELVEKLSGLSRDAIKPDLPYKLKLKSLWLFWIKLMVSNNREFSFLSQLKQSPYNDVCKAEIRQINRAVAFELFDMGKREGLIKELDNEALGAIMEALMLKTVMLISEGKVNLNEREMNTWFSFFWDAVKN